MIISLPILLSCILQAISSSWFYLYLLHLKSHEVSWELCYWIWALNSFFLLKKCIYNFFCIVFIHFLLAHYFLYSFTFLSTLVFNCIFFFCILTHSQIIPSIFGVGCMNRAWIKSLKIGFVKRKKKSEIRLKSELSHPCIKENCMKRCRDLDSIISCYLNKSIQTINFCCHEVLFITGQVNVYMYNIQVYIDLSFSKVMNLNYCLHILFIYRKCTSIRQAPVFRHLRALRKSPWKFIIWMNEL